MYLPYFLKFWIREIADLPDPYFPHIILFCTSIPPTVKFSSRYPHGFSFGCFFFLQMVKYMDLVLFCLSFLWNLSRCYSMQFGWCRKFYSFLLNEFKSFFFLLKSCPLFSCLQPNWYKYNLFSFWSIQWLESGITYFIYRFLIVMLMCFCLLVWVRARGEPC